MIASSLLGGAHSTASADTKPSRIVKVSGARTAEGAASLTDGPFAGVSHEWTRYPANSASDDGFIAKSGDPLPVATDGMIVNVVLGGTVTDTTKPLTATADGKAVTADLSTISTSAYQYTVGYPLQTGVSGDKVPVVVKCERHPTHS